jgi:hypothetical protein
MQYIAKLKFLQLVYPAVLYFTEFMDFLILLNRNVNKETFLENEIQKLKTGCGGIKKTLEMFVKHQCSPLSSCKIEKGYTLALII